MWQKAIWHTINDYTVYSHIATSTLLVSGSADNTAKIWDVSNGKCLKSWEFNTAVRRVQFSEDDKMVLIVTEPRMGFPATLQIFNVENGLTESSKELLVFRQVNGL